MPYIGPAPEALVNKDLQGGELILDSDADTTITADTDDQIDIKISGADDFAFKANTFEVQTGSNVDMNGTELILDADGDTSITADTDDQIDVRIAGADDFQFTANTFSVLSGSSQSFADSAEAKFGDGNDLTIKHDGSNSIIQDSGTGQLNIAASQTSITNAARGENIAIFTEDAGFRFFHDNTEVFSSGTNYITGTVGLNVTQASAAAANIFVNPETSSSANSIVFRDGDSNDCGIIGINAANNTASYGTSSDYRLKENVTYTWDATTRLKQLKPARFNFISNPDNETLDGFLAHEAQTVVPESVNGDKDAVNSNGDPVYQNIDQSKLVPLLTKALQELEARITALESS